MARAADPSAMTEDRSAPRLLRLLLAINAAATFAAAIVLAIKPAAIPGAVGISLSPDQNFIAYLLAASELAIGILCFLALRSRSREAILQAVIILIVLHLASGVAGLASASAHPLILWNVAVRIAMVLALGWSAKIFARQVAPAPPAGST